MLTNHHCRVVGVEKFSADAQDGKCKCVPDPCTALNAELVDRSSGECRCWWRKKGIAAALEAHFNGLAGQAAYGANNQCSTSLGSRTIFLNTTKAGCSCARKHRLADSRRALPVDIAAVDFCRAAADHVRDIFWKKAKGKGEKKMSTFAKIMARPGGFSQRFSREAMSNATEICERVLTGDFNAVNASQQSEELLWAAKAGNLSEHENAEGLGRLDALVRNMSNQSEKARYKSHLEKVCRDECISIVEATVKNMGQIDMDRNRGITWLHACSERVVKKVEGEMLGCCGRACGWNKNQSSCTNWPFLSVDRRVRWQKQCCSEYNVLNGSARQKMCNSVLTPEQASLVSQHDRPEPKGNDTGAVLVGQDPPLFWTEKGTQSEVGQEFADEAVANESVSQDVLLLYPGIRSEGLKKGWFIEEENRPNSWWHWLNPWTWTSRKSSGRSLMAKIEEPADQFTGEEDSEEDWYEDDQCLTTPDQSQDCSEEDLQDHLEGCDEKNRWQPSRQSGPCTLSDAVKVQTSQDCASLPATSWKLDAESGRELDRYFKFARGEPLKCYIAHEQHATPCSFTEVTDYKVEMVWYVLIRDSATSTSP
ncbi:Fem1b [Symbiodinium sp. CCMP2456]|nr:Fem1b [Symbiodinium sp. CCMP2456]